MTRWALCTRLCTSSRLRALPAATPAIRDPLRPSPDPTRLAARPDTIQATTPNSTLPATTPRASTQVGSAPAPAQEATTRTWKLNTPNAANLDTNQTLV